MVLKGVDGVVETFLALLRTTWRAVDARYPLAPRLGVGEEELLRRAAALFGMGETLDELLARCFGVAA
jgi:hypothetical protein